MSRSVLESLAAPDDRVDDFELALSEACANAVRHAGAETYTVSLSIEEDRCEVEIADLGGDFDVTVLAAANEEAPPTESESGRGLYLMKMLTDRCEFRREDDGTRVRLVKRFPRPIGPSGPS